MKRLIGLAAAAALLAPAAVGAADALRQQDRDRVRDCTTCDRTPDRDRLRDGSCTTATLLETKDQDRARDQDRDRTHLWDGAPWWRILFGRR